MRAAHHVLSLRHSDNAHAHLRRIIRNIPDPLPGHIRNTHMLIVILQVAILGGDVVSELAIKTILQLHLPIRSCDPFSLGLILASSPHDEDHSVIVGILIEASLAVPLHSLARLLSAQELPFS